MQIVIPYAPRPLQSRLHQQLSEKRWGVVVCHRRWGKTVMAINHLLRDAILSQKTNPRYSYISPTYKQSKAVAWDYLKVYAGAIPGAKFHETELRCDLPNGARITLLGSDNVDGLRGIYLDGAVIDEVADIPERLFPEIIRPALSDRAGWCVFIGTPRGTNAFYDYYEQAVASDEWVDVVYKASETNILPAEELEAARSMMSENQYQQEFECSWVANVEGSIYGKEMQAALEDGRITNVPHDPTTKVHTFWDLGIGDSTAIWFAQVGGAAGRGVHVIDFYEARGEGLPHYCSVLSRKNYNYGDHYAPHDIEVRELGSGKSRREVAWELGLNFKVVPKLPIEDGIHALQMLIPRCYFDREKCKQGLEALRQYHRAYKEKARTFRLSPVHDWSSHGADAARYMAISIREGSMERRPQQRQAVNNYDPFARAAAV